MADRDPEQIRRELDKIGPQTELATILAELARARSKDRSFIVKMVVWVYAFSIGVYIAYAALRGIFCGNLNSTADISEIIKVAVLPVLTLVIGYYLRTAQSDG